jgi:hypothetical protein
MLPSNEEAKTETEIEVPDEFLCPLTLEIMQDPVMTRYGNSYERESILQWLGRGKNHCPLTRRPLALQDVVTNHSLRQKICQWQKENEQDITVIMTPEIPNITGYFTMPSKRKDLDETERSEEDDEELVEYSPDGRTRTNRSLRDDGRTRRSSERFHPSRRQKREQRAAASRRFWGMFAHQATARTSA